MIKKKSTNNDYLYETFKMQIQHSDSDLEWENGTRYKGW